MVLNPVLNRTKQVFPDLSLSLQRVKGEPGEGESAGQANCGCIIAIRRMSLVPRVFHLPTHWGGVGR